MRRRNMYAGLVTVAALLGAASSVHAMVWTDANVANANTIALYHFDEGSGTSAANSVAGGTGITLTANGSWSSDAGWLASPAGSSLANTSSTNGSYMGQTTAMQSVDWGLPGITVSFWLKDLGNLDQDNSAYIMGHDGWRNMQSRVGYHTQWNNAVLLHDGVGGPSRNAGEAWGYLSTIANGQWHHVGLVFDNSADTASLYVDNALQLSWGTTGGASSLVTEFMDVGIFSGRMDEMIIQGNVVTDFSNGMNAVPEPTALAVVGLAGVMVTMRRRRSA